MFIGVDIGGTNIKVGLVNEKGEILSQKSCPTKVGRKTDLIINDIVDLILNVTKEKCIDMNQIKSVGIGIPGLANKDSGTVECVNMGWYDVELKKLMEEKINKPVFIDNDASVAALAEHIAGSMKNSKNALFITLGTGVGGGIIINNSLYSGSNGVASEIGHMVVGENFYDCNCGKNGCLETFASATALINHTIKLIKENKENTIILDEVEGNLDNINAKIIFDCAKKGDKIATHAVKRFVKYLSIGINNIINIIDPEIISIGGGVSMAGEYLIDLVKIEVEKNKLFKKSNIGEIVLAKTGNSAGIIGAAMLYKY